MAIKFFLAELFKKATGGGGNRDGVELGLLDFSRGVLSNHIVPFLEKCSAGTMYVPLFGCQPCPIGTFQPNQGELQCNACETNHTTRATRSVYYGDCILKGRFAYSKSPHIRTNFFAQAEIGSYFKDTITIIRVYKFLFEE